MKARVTSYTFDASAQEVTAAQFSDITLEGIQLITNVTDNVIIYQFNNPAKGGTLSTDTLTLTYDTTSMSDADDLMILVEDGVTTQTVSGTVTADTELTTADLDTGAGSDTRAVVGLVGSKSGGAALIPGDATAGLKVDLGADNDVTVTSGSITANAGTNLNTSLLALESGGNLAGAATSLAIMDDWDESDRAKVNLIAGQAGITAGAGAVAASTPRVTHASDDPVTTSVQLIDDVIKTDDAGFTPATDKVAMVGAQMDDTGTDSVDEGDAGALRMSANRNLYVRLRDNAGNERGLNIDANGALAATVTNGTAANLKAEVVGTGTFATQVDGAALTSLQLIDDTVFTDDTSTHSTGSTKGQGIMAVANPTDASVDANDIGMIAMTTARALKNDITTIAGTAPTTAGKVDVKGADGDVFVRQATASNLNMTEASASAIKTSVELIDDTVYTDDTSTHSTGTSKGIGVMAAATPTDGSVNANDIGMVAMTTDRKLHVSVQDAIPAGTNAIGKLAANSGVDIGDVDVTSIAAGSNLIGDVGVQPRTSNGLDTFMASGSDGSTALTSTAQAVKASAGQLFGYYIYNPNSSAQFVHFYNTAAASVTVGTTNPKFTLTIPASSAANLMGDIGITFSNAGWSIAATSTAGGNGAPSTALDAVVWYK